MKVSGWIMAVIGTISLVAVTIVSVIFWYGFANNCKDYLKLAGDAPTIEKADEFLGMAVSYIEKKQLTNGNSAYIFTTPTNDLKIWYGQVRGAKDTAESIIKRATQNPASVSQLERDNALMKIREVVLDNSQSGTSVTTPASITWFPYQWVMVIWWWITILIAVAGWFLIFATSDFW